MQPRGWPGDFRDRRLSSIGLGDCSWIKKQSESSFFGFCSWQYLSNTIVTDVP